MIIDITTHRDWEPCEGPCGQNFGWYRPRGSKAKVLAARAVVHDDATIKGGTIHGGTIMGGTIMGGAIWGGTIWGGTIWGGTPPYAHAVRWPASISSPGNVTIGCQTHSIADWLREDDCSPVPWAEHCTGAERKLIVIIIKLLDMQMQAGVCDWRSK